MALAIDLPRDGREGRADLVVALSARGGSGVEPLKFRPSSQLRAERSIIREWECGSRHTAENLTPRGEERRLLHL